MWSEVYDRNARPHAFYYYVYMTNILICSIIAVIYNVLWLWQEVISEYRSNKQCTGTAYTVDL